MTPSLHDPFMAVLMYNELKNDANPRESLLDFLASAYQAGAKLAKWNYEELKVPPLNQL